MKLFFLRALIACGLFLISATDLFALEKRSAYDIPLALLSPRFNPDGTLDEVFVTFGSESEGWAISCLDDRYVAVNMNGLTRKDVVYREEPEYAQLITPFEAEVLDKVCQSFIKTLQIYERDLAGFRGDRLRYLDPHFISFFRNFHHLVCAARNSPNALPRDTYIEDSLYEISDTSEKTDKRIELWRENPDQIIKLRIASKELIFQIKQWQKKELRNAKRDVWEDNSKKFVEIYELFLRLYFNIPTSPEKR